VGGGCPPWGVRTNPPERSPPVRSRPERVTSFLVRRQRSGLNPLDPKSQRPSIYDIGTIPHYTPSPQRTTPSTLPPPPQNRIAPHSYIPYYTDYPPRRSPRLRLRVTRVPPLLRASPLHPGARHTVRLTSPPVATSPYHPTPRGPGPAVHRPMCRPPHPPHQLPPPKPMATDRQTPKRPSANAFSSPQNPAPGRWTMS